MIGLRKQEYHSVVRRICRLVNTMSFLDSPQVREWLITLVQVFFGCPHRFPQFALWDDLSFGIPSLYAQTTEPVERPLYLKSCAIDSAAMIALSTEFITVAAAYDIVNIYEGGTGSDIVSGLPNA